MTAVVKNLAKLPAATSQILTNVSKLQTFHGLLEERRDKYAPLAYHTYDNLKQKTTWHPIAHAWVDEGLPVSKKVSKCRHFLLFSFDLGVQRILLAEKRHATASATCIAVRFRHLWHPSVGRFPDDFKHCAFHIVSQFGFPTMGICPLPSAARKTLFPKSWSGILLMVMTCGSKWVCNNIFPHILKYPCYRTHVTTPIEKAFEGHSEQ